MYSFMSYGLGWVAVIERRTHLFNVICLDVCLV